MYGLNSPPIPCAPRAPISPCSPLSHKAVAQTGGGRRRSCHRPRLPQHREDGPAEVDGLDARAATLRPPDRAGVAPAKLDNARNAATCKRQDAWTWLATKLDDALRNLAAGKTPRRGRRQSLTTQRATPANRPRNPSREGLPTAHATAHANAQATAQTTAGSATTHATAHATTKATAQTPAGSRKQLCLCPNGPRCARSALPESPRARPLGHMCPQCAPRARRALKARRACPKHRCAQIGHLVPPGNILE